MIVRIFDDNTVAVLDYVDPTEEDEFIKLNPQWNLKKVDSLPEAMFGYYKYDPQTDTIVVDTERETEAYRQMLLDRAKELVEDYITMYYPYDKQQADNHQKDYYGTAILMIRSQNTSSEPLTLDQIYLQVGNAANKILDGQATLQDLVSAYPQEEQFYWEQLIKAGVRKAWTVRCVYIYRSYVNQVKQASAIDDLKELDKQYLDFPEFPNFD